MMKKLLCLLLATFALSLFVPTAEAAAIKTKPALVKTAKKNKSAKRTKHRKHSKRHHKAAKSKA
jgi:hypothetical protein